MENSLDKENAPHCAPNFEGMKTLGEMDKWDCKEVGCWLLSYDGFFVKKLVNEFHNNTIDGKLLLGLRKEVMVSEYGLSEHQADVFLFRRDNDKRVVKEEVNHLDKVELSRCDSNEEGIASIVNQWSFEHVCLWLLSTGGRKMDLIVPFYMNQICGQQLLNITAEHLLAWDYPECDIESFLFWRNTVRDEGFCFKESFKKIFTHPRKIYAREPISDMCAIADRSDSEAESFDSMASNESDESSSMIAGHEETDDGIIELSVIENTHETKGDVDVVIGGSMIEVETSGKPDISLSEVPAEISYSKDELNEDPVAETSGKVTDGAYIQLGAVQSRLDKHVERNNKAISRAIQETATPGEDVEDVQDPLELQVKCAEKTLEAIRDGKQKKQPAEPGSPTHQQEIQSAKTIPNVIQTHHQRKRDNPQFQEDQQSQQDAPKQTYMLRPRHDVDVQFDVNNGSAHQNQDHQDLQPDPIIQIVQTPQRLIRKNQTQNPQPDQLQQNLKRGPEQLLFERGEARDIIQNQGSQPLQNSQYELMDDSLQKIQTKSAQLIQRNKEPPIDGEQIQDSLQIQTKSAETIQPQFRQKQAASAQYQARLGPDPEQIFDQLQIQTKSAEIIQPALREKPTASSRKSNQHQTSQQNRLGPDSEQIQIQTKSAEIIQPTVRQKQFVNQQPNRLGPDPQQFESSQTLNQDQNSRQDRFDPDSEQFQVCVHQSEIQTKSAEIIQPALRQKPIPSTQFSNQPRYSQQARVGPDSEQFDNQIQFSESAKQHQNRLGPDPERLDVQFENQDDSGHQIFQNQFSHQRSAPDPQDLGHQRSVLDPASQPSEVATQNLQLPIQEELFMQIWTQLSLQPQKSQQDYLFFTQNQTLMGWFLLTAIAHAAATPDQKESSKTLGGFGTREMAWVA